MWFGHGFGWGGMIFGGLMMLLFWGGLIVLVVLAVRAFSTSGSRETPRDNNASETPLEIVKMRYARGEISKAEYEEIRRDLTA
jgi:putative membrane protein